MFSFERSSSKEYGGESKKDTPVPMPNTEVKLLTPKVVGGNCLRG